MRLLDERYDEHPAGAPAWSLSFGDLMSLLLILFVMLVSMSELRQSDKYQGVADSLQNQFGKSRRANIGPGELKPRNPSLAAQAVAGRQRRTALVEAFQVDDSVVIEFAPGSSTLTAGAREQLHRLAERLEDSRWQIRVQGQLAADIGSFSTGPVGAVVSVLTEEMQVERARIAVELRGADIPNLPSTPAGADQVVVSLVPATGPVAAGQAANRKQPF
jgi:hypothetical protein